LRCGGKEKINAESFVEDGIAAKATGLVENEREKVKREQCGKECSRRCDGCWRSRVGGNCENLCSRERP